MPKYDVTVTLTIDADDQTNAWAIANVMTHRACFGRSDAEVLSVGEPTEVEEPPEMGM